MATYSIHEARSQLTKLIEAALAGEQVLIANGEQAPVMLVPAEQSHSRRKPGSGKGQLLYMAPDFDATPPEFEDDSQ